MAFDRILGDCDSVFFFFFSKPACLSRFHSPQSYWEKLFILYSTL